MTLVYKNSIGINFQILTNFDLTGYSSLSWYLTKPSGTKLTKTPTVVDITTGELSYESISGDLDETGQYKSQTKATYADGDVIPSEIDTFMVYEPL
jgi:hypothetical protein